MSLPIIPKTRHRLKSKYLPTGSVEYSPFTVGQESILIDASESKGKPEHKEKMIEALRQIVAECIVTPNYPVNSLPLFMLELLFVKLRQKSIGETMEFSYMCRTPTEGEKTCDTALDVVVDLEEVGIKDYPDHVKMVMVTDEIGMTFKYPSMGMLDVESNEAAAVVACIESIFEGERLYDLDNTSNQELIDFYKKLEMPVKLKIMKQFMATMPHLFYEKKVKCQKCGTEHTLQFTELADFFT